MSEPKIGKIYKTNDKLFTGFKKPRHVVVSKYFRKRRKYGVSRILSLKGKGRKINTLLPIKDYGYFTEPSGIDYHIYGSAKGKNGKREEINFGSMKDLDICLDDEDIKRMEKHIKNRGGKRNKMRYKKYKK